MDNDAHLQTRPRRTSHNIINEILFSSFHSGVHTSIFRSSDHELREAMLLHGLQPHGFTTRQAITMYLSHLVNGSCHQHRHTVPRAAGSRDRTACRVISQGFESSDALKKFIVQILLVANSDMITTDNLLITADVIGVHFADRGRTNLRRRIHVCLSNVLHSESVQSAHMPFTVDKFERLSRPELLSLADNHYIPINHLNRHTVTKDELRNMILAHLSDGTCGSVLPPEHTPQYLNEARKHLLILRHLRDSLSIRPLKRLLQIYSIPYDQSDNTKRLRMHLTKFISDLNRRSRASRMARQDRDIRQASEFRGQWPKKPGANLKSKIETMFRHATSKDVLSESTCGSCAENVTVSAGVHVNLSELPLDLLQSSVPSVIPTPELYGENHDVMLLRDSIDQDCNGNARAFLCHECALNLRRKTLPPLSMANHNYIGNVPDCLKNLTMVEECMIARSRCKCWIVQLKEGPESVSNSSAQRGMKGHIIVYPQEIDDYSTIMPASIDTICAPICVVFVGSQPPSKEWLKSKAKPLIVRREKVRDALLWLKANNPLYEGVTIDHNQLNLYPANDILPVHVEQIETTDAVESLTSGYDTYSARSADNCPRDCDENATQNDDSYFDKITVTNVDALATTNELRCAAFRHFRDSAKRTIQIPHGNIPESEFGNPSLFPKIYPTLFPYGIGGPENDNRDTELSMKRNLKHLFSLRDKRFQQHYSFLFTAFNILQRRQVLLHTFLKVKAADFDRLAEEYSNISADTIATVTERLAKGNAKTCNSPEEKRILDLMKEVNVITSHVFGSAASKVDMRNEIRGLMLQFGLPSFYITINLADVYNPLMKFLSGADIDIDDLSEGDLPSYHEQSVMIANNPALGARFFNIYVKAFIRCILGWDNDDLKKDGGILGRVNAHYGCVEAQGRGTLHCHLIVWLDGAHNVDEIRQRVSGGDTDFQARLIDYLDDAISTALPPVVTIPENNESTPRDNIILNCHPCKTRGIPCTENDVNGNEHPRAQYLADFRRLVEHCQRHKHTSTCYKYWPGPPHPKTCRFNLDENDTEETTHFDDETGDLHLRHLDGLVNNFNDTILKCIRCNMDIKFIGSGPSAKAILFYITDYITKSQLKAHVAFAALEIAVRKLDLDSQIMDPDSPVARAKKLLQKCAFSIISRQELSAPQVMSYLLDLEDHFTSHTFRKFYWTSFEKFIDRGAPLTDLRSNEHYSENVDPVESDSETSDDGEEQSAGLEPEDQCEELVVTDLFGSLVAHANQVADYQQRGSFLHKTCLWDYVSSIKKIKNANSRTDFADSGTESDCSDIDESFDPLSSTEWRRPQLQFHSSHREFFSHIQKVIRPSKRLIPVPTGPSMPRRDRPHELERYQRLMLIFFKPWYAPADLLGSHTSWSAAFDDFMQDCHEHHKSVMSNMQVIHECKDSRDKHFTEQLKIRKKQRRFGERGSGNCTDNLGSENITADILTHIRDVDSCYADQNKKSQSNAGRCQASAESGGVFSRKFAGASLFRGSENLQTVSSNNFDTECSWRNFYSEQSERAKRSSRLESVTNSTEHSQQSQLSLGNIVNSNIESSSNSHNSIQISETANSELHPQTDAYQHARQVAAKYTLNREQRRAFDIITDHRITNSCKQLRMYIGGPGGTGKSRVIKALRCFFDERSESRMLRLSAYTGIAANNIEGMTLHSALHLNARNVKSAATTNNLIASWQGIEYLFIDEISMIGCDLLVKIDEGLRRAKENDKLFGGVNVIFAGDFAQLSPVGDPSLYAPITRSQGKTKQSQNTIFGKLLWSSVDTVVMLTENMRQAGSVNSNFHNTLTRLRTGCCTKSDFDLLNTRLLDRLSIDWSSGDWDDAPIVVSDNETKDALNMEAAKSYAQQRGENMNFYYAKHYRQKELLTDKDFNNYLNSMSTGKTHHIMGALPLAIGMPVMLCHNYDVPFGVVNGCIGRVKHINYEEDECGNRFATSCVIVSDTSRYKNADGHAQREFMVFPEDTSITFRHPHTNVICTVHRVQLPIVPAFAITAHKSQGQTYPRVMLDLHDTRGSESPYVMLSRSTCLDNVVILRPFSISRIQCRQSESSRLEFKRLGILRLQTIMRCGSPIERAAARELLGDNGTADWCNSNLTLSNMDDCLKASSTRTTKLKNKNIQDFSSSEVSNKRQYSEDGG